MSKAEQRFLIRRQPPPGHGPRGTGHAVIGVLTSGPTVPVGPEVTLGPTVPVGTVVTTVPTAWPCHLGSNH